LRRNCLLKHVIEGTLEGRIEVKYGLHCIDFHKTHNVYYLNRIKNKRRIVKGTTLWREGEFTPLEVTTMLLMGLLVKECWRQDSALRSEGQVLRCNGGLSLEFY
jgi:hypothetical protein